MNQQTVEKIVNAALAVMARRANIELTGTMFGKVVGEAEILSAIHSDPAGNTAFRFAELVTLGVNTYEALA